MHGQSPWTPTIRGQPSRTRRTLVSNDLQTPPNSTRVGLRRRDHAALCRSIRPRMRQHHRSDHGRRARHPNGRRRQPNALNAFVPGGRRGGGRSQDDRRVEAVLSGVGSQGLPALQGFGAVFGRTASASVSQRSSGRQTGAATNTLGKPSKPASWSFSRRR